MNGNLVSPEEQNRISSFVRKADKGLYEKYLLSADSISLIAGGGSDRCFYRVRKGAMSIVVMLSSFKDADFQNYLSVATFLKDLGIRVPTMYGFNREHHLVFMEDVGDVSVYRKCQEGMGEDEIRYWYQEILGTLAIMQVQGGRNWEKCTALRERTFDYSALRWETAYFQEYFLRKYLNISTGEDQDLIQEFEALAGRIAREPLHFMHRDFQSQNIMLCDGAVRILDFQGARRGLLQYDLASLLKDCYIVLSDNVVKTLITFYLHQVDEQGIIINDEEGFYDTLDLAGLQRNMQALGAFSYLSLMKGKTWFKQYIPAGVHHLAKTLQRRSDFPCLRTLIEKVCEAGLPT